MVAPNNKKTYGSDPGLMGVSLAEGRKQIRKSTVFILKQLVTRDFKLKYRRSVLGVVWSVLNPLLMMAI